MKRRKFRTFGMNGTSPLKSEFKCLVVCDLEGKKNIFVVVQ